MAVWPRVELLTGVDNLLVAATLKNLGIARSVSGRNMYGIYKNTGVNLDRCHFELLARASNPYVRIVKAPRELGFLPGEKVNYQILDNKVKLLPRKTVLVRNALGKVLCEGVLDLTVGTELDAQAIKRLEDNDVRNVMVVDGS